MIEEMPPVIRQPERSGWRAFLPWVALGVSAVILLLLIIHLPLNVDELEFHRATRWVASGLVPYRDFWEHHTPLQWYLFAPVAGYSNGVSASNILLLRWAQIPLEILTLLVVFVLMLNRKIRWPVMALAVAPILGSRIFGPSFVEYRIDVPMNLFFLTGLLLLEWDPENRKRWINPFLAGACFGLAVLCSQRMVFLALFTPVIYFTGFHRGERGWRPFISLRGLWVVAGGGTAALLTTLVLWGQGALHPFLLQCVRDNSIFIASWKGSTHSSFWFQFFILPWQIGDWAFLLAVMLGFGGLVFVFLKIRSPAAPTRLAILVIIEFLLLPTITISNVYQQQTMIWLLTIMGAFYLNAIWIIGRMRARSLLAVGGTAVVLAAIIVTNAKLTWGIAKAIQQHQDHVIRLVHTIAKPSEVVMDGSGYAFDNKPAWRFWFLTSIAKCLTEQGVYPVLDEALFLRNKPKVLVMDSHLEGYLVVSPKTLQEFVCRNYLPLETCVWIPAPNVLLSGNQKSYSWIILRSGRYRASLGDPKQLALWFQWPFGFSYIENFNMRHRIPNIRKIQMDARVLSAPDDDVPLTWLLDGHPIRLKSDGWLSLKAGQKLAVIYSGKRPVPLLLVPSDFPILFMIPFPKVPLEYPRDEPPGR